MARRRTDRLVVRRSRRRHLSAFLQGSWAVSFRLDTERESFVVEIKDGAWRVPDGP